MSLNALMRWLKPREMVFFDLLDAAAENVHKAALLFERELRTGDASRWPAMRREMKELEHAGDEYTHQLIDKLNQHFVTPIEREDILALAHALDDVVDRLDNASERLVLYRIQHIMPSAQELASVIVAGAKELVPLIHSLRTMNDLKTTSDRIRLVHTLENQADSIYHVALAQVFEDPKDAIEVIKWKELLENIEDATDRIELVAQVVGSTVMRNA